MGLGQKSQAMLAEIGVTDTEPFLASDPFELYRAMAEAGVPVSLNLLYAMIGAQEQCHWQQVKRERRLDILMRLEDMGIPVT